MCDHFRQFFPVSIVCTFEASISWTRFHKVGATFFPFLTYVYTYRQYMCIPIAYSSRVQMLLHGSDILLTCLVFSCFDSRPPRHVQFDELVRCENAKFVDPCTGYVMNNIVRCTVAPQRRKRMKLDFGNVREKVPYLGADQIYSWVCLCIYDG